MSNTSPIGINYVNGVKTAATKAGIRFTQDRDDLSLIVFDQLAVVAAVGTKSSTRAPGVDWTRKVAKHGKLKAILINSGNANVATPTAVQDCASVVNFLAGELNVNPLEVIYHSTGIIGKPLPVDKVKQNIPKLMLALGQDNGVALANAILTTDLVIKTVQKKVADLSIKIGAVGKGSGMIHPNLATMLCYITTDATMSSRTLQRALKLAVEASFNQMSVDMDTSTSDAVVLASTGTDRANEIRRGTKRFDQFVNALTDVCVELTKMIARDGEGATKLIEVQLSGAKNTRDARKMARQIICSPLVKTAIHGGDNNWGRVQAAIGSTTIKVKPERIKIEMLNLKTEKVTIKVDLGLGQASARAWGCDLSKAYIDINTNYN